MKGAPTRFQHPRDAQPPRNGAFAKASRKADFARGFGGGTALNKHDCGHTIIACQAYQEFTMKLVIRDSEFSGTGPKK